jgi:hypothetical protein
VDGKELKIELRESERCIARVVLSGDDVIVPKEMFVRIKRQFVDRFELRQALLVRRYNDLKIDQTGHGRVSLHIFLPLLLLSCFLLLFCLSLSLLLFSFSLCLSLPRSLLLPRVAHHETPGPLSAPARDGLRVCEAGRRSG